MYVLTERELNVIFLMAEGRSEAEIAKQLSISEDDVRGFLLDIYGDAAESPVSARFRLTG